MSRYNAYNLPENLMRAFVALKAGLFFLTGVGTKIHFTGNLNPLNRRMIPLSIFVSFNIMFEYSIAKPKLFTVVRQAFGLVSKMI